MMIRRGFSRPTAALAVGILSGGLVSSAYAADGALSAIGAHAKAILTIDDKQFKDLNSNGKLDAYEDWRLPVAQRADDLTGKMSLEEKAGMMLIDTLNAELQGAVSATALQYIQNEHMTRFIFPQPGCAQS